MKNPSVWLDAGLRRRANADVTVDVGDDVGGVPPMMRAHKSVTGKAEKSG